MCDHFVKLAPKELTYSDEINFFFSSRSVIAFMTNCPEQLLNRSHLLLNVLYKVNSISCVVLDVEEVFEMMYVLVIGD